MSRRKINQITILLLLLGFGSALVVYWTASHAPIDPLLNDAWARKKYLRELQVIGGKANVLAADFEAWFGELWEGESLAWTLAVLTVAGTLGFRFVARLPDPAAPPADEETRPPGQT